MAAPSAFSAALEKWLLEKTKDSIFFINIRPNLDLKAELVVRMQTAKTVEIDRRDQELDSQGHSFTGFIVEANAAEFKILTTAHSIGHVFTASKPISVVDANRLFDTYVLCDHYESSFRQPGQNTHTQRVYAKANIIGISCQRDMMLLGVPRDDLKDLTSICTSQHPPLACSLIPPTALDECLMISWPPLRHRSTAKGRISHASRTMVESDLRNPAGYSMTIMQAQMESEYGSSGAPLLNASGEVIGMLHGGFEQSFSYFVAVNEIRSFLTQQGVVNRHI